MDFEKYQSAMMKLNSKTKHNLISANLLEKIQDCFKDLFTLRESKETEFDVGLFDYTHFRAVWESINPDFDELPRIVELKPPARGDMIISNNITLSGHSLNQIIDDFTERIQILNTNGIQLGKKDLLGPLTTILKKIKDFKFDEEYEGYSHGEDVEFSHRVSQKYSLYFTSYAKAFHNPTNNSISEVY